MRISDSISNRRNSNPFESAPKPFNKLANPMQKSTDPFVVNTKSQYQLNLNTSFRDSIPIHTEHINYHTYIHPHIFYHFLLKNNS